MASIHSRNASADTTTSSYNMILEHLLQYPGSYEIPLRTMYTLNCTPRAQPLPKDITREARSNSTPTSPHSNWNESESASVNFTSQLMNHISSMPGRQPSSLPPAFIVSFVGRVFHPSLSLVDFPQALTALDYLRDLENRRKKEMVAAFERVHIHLDSFESDIDAISERYPGIALWANNLQGKDQKAEILYARIWLSLRRWVLINELSLTPFNKLNCMGMLNTLLPPQHGKLPSNLLDAHTLKQERASFFDYIQQVQKKGPSVLESLAAGDKTKWEAVQKEVDKYLRVAKNVIDDCMATVGPEDFKKCVEEPRKGKKTDSGVSFGSEIRPDTGSSVEDTRPASPALSQKSSKGFSKLEKLTREFKRMRVKTRPDVEEMVKMEQETPAAGENKGKKIKKARSLANLKHNSSSTSLAGSRKNSDAVPFDADEMKRARQMYEASTVTKK
ncbi:hypothetical protein P280DRAFT_31615 [Massarina eburnea CBS 473.64]|uniref:Uncharacterized protein n=1 Tax=Massarina eburnea CBS 473.64 TaxID=1395130 RepID=A0A6A6S1D9_9PLEO|nr:hypothetical protein P280DRAFT_31615 [Massarina eburnea CBS 473.64]